MSVSTEEGIVDTGLVPTCQQLCVRVSKETTNICSREGNTRKSDSEKHWRRQLKMLPTGNVVSCPDGSETLGTGKEGAREDKGTLLGLIAVGQALSSSRMLLKKR